MTRVDLCGATRVDGRPGVVTGRQELLLAVLAIRGPAGIRRDELTDVLWPDVPPAAYGRALDPLLSRLRRVVGPIEGRGLVRLVTPTPTDLVEAGRQLAAAREAADPVRAVGLAQAAATTLSAPILPAHDDPWTIRQRGLLADKADDARAVAAEAGVRAGGRALDVALQAATALVAHRPLREDATALLMTVQEAAGDTAAALTVYEAMRARLADELGTIPGARLREQHLRLIAGARPTPSPSPARVPSPAATALPAALAHERRRAIVGRTAELAAVIAGLRLGAAPRLVIVEGPSGAGKTRLVAEAAAAREAAGDLVVLGRCHRGATSPFAPVVEALRPLVRTLDPEHLAAALGPLAGDLAALLPAVHRRIAVTATTERDRDPLTARFRLFEAVVALLGAAGRPVLLVLDDLQWLDRSSALLLTHLLQVGDLGEVAILAASRPADGPGTPASALRDAAGASTLVPLPGLGVEAVRELVDGAEPDADAGARRALAERLHARTGGSPLLVLASLSTQAPVAGSDDLERTVRATLGRASPAARGFVRLLAVDGGVAQPAVLAHAAGVAAAEVEALADQAHEAGLLGPRLGPGHIGTLHDAVREAVLGDLGPDESASVHRRLALAYQAVHAGDDDAVVTEIARLWAGADGRAIAVQAAQYGERAARRALGSLAYEQAAGQARTAREQLETSDQDDARRLTLLMLEGDAYNRASALVQAREALGAALALAQRLGEDDLVARVALEHGGHRLAAGILDPELIAALEAGLAAASTDDVVHARLAGRLGAALFNGPVDRRDALAAGAIAQARRAGDPRALAETLLWRHVGELFRADPEARGGLVDEAEAIAQQHGLRELALHARMLRFSDLLEQGDVAAARAEIVTWSREAEAARVPYHHWAAAVSAPTLALLDGDLPEARRRLEEASRLALPIGQDAVVVSAHAAHELVLGIWGGQAAEVAAMLRGMLADVGDVPVWESATALAELLAGETASARERVERLTAGSLDVVVDANRLALGSFGAMAGVAAGAHADALGALHALLAPHRGRWVVQHYGSAVHGPVDVRLALLETALGRLDDAAASLARADAALGARPPRMLALDRDHAEARLLHARGAGAGADAEAIVEVVGGQARDAGLPGWAALLESVLAADARPAA